MDDKTETSEHAEVMGRLDRDEILIGVDAAAARRFFTDNSAATLRRRLGESLALRKTVVVLAFFLGPLAILSSSVFAVKAFGWWGIGVIPASVIAWFFYSSMASVGRQRIFRVLSFFAATVAICVFRDSHTYMPAQVWLAVLAGAFLLARLTYYSASVFVKLLVIRNPLAYEFLLDKAVFFKEADPSAPLPSRPIW